MLPSSLPSHEVPILTACTPQDFVSSVQSLRRPCIIRGVSVGPCVSLWSDLSYLERQTENKHVKAHVAPDPLQLDFKKKTFKYISMPLHELLRRAKGGEDATKLYKPFLAEGEGYYLRDVGSIDPKGKGGPTAPACIYRDYPELAKDVSLASWYKKESYFSSVLRVTSPGLRLFTHYDVLDNLYVQVIGIKRVVLWPPEDALWLYLDGDKSRVVDVDHPDVSLFPLFPKAKRHECYLFPGDVLFIPSFWFHNTLSTEFSVAVNVFIKELPPSLYDERDMYGNKDLLPAARGKQTLARLLRSMQCLPPDYRDFYGRVFIKQIEEACLTKPLFSLLLDQSKTEETEERETQETARLCHEGDSKRTAETLPSK